jgi:hypothetical protein
MENIDDLDRRIRINFLLSLPPELSLEVVERLTVQQLLFILVVCKGWYRLIIEELPQLWHHLQFNSNDCPLYTCLTDQALYTLLSHVGKAVRKLDLGLCWRISNKALRAVAQFCPNLQTFILEGNYSICGAAVDLVLLNAPHLQRLKVTHSRHCSSDEPNIILFSSLQSLKQLAPFSVFDALLLFDTDNVQLVKGKDDFTLSSLTSLECSNSCLRSQSWDFLANAPYVSILEKLIITGKLDREEEEKSFVNLLSKANKLRKLRTGIRSMELIEGCKAIAKCSALERLEIYTTDPMRTKVDPGVLAKLINHLQGGKLKYLKLEMHYTSLTDQVYKTLCLTQPNLVKLSVSYIPDEAIEYLAQHLCKLKSLQSTFEIDFNGLLLRPNFISHLTKMDFIFPIKFDMTQVQQLDSVKLVSANLTETLWEEENQIYTHFFRMHSQLKNLTLYASGATDETLKAIANYCPRLKAINLRNVLSITDRGMVALVSGCPKLSTLILGKNSLITDTTADAIAQHLRDLWYLSLDETNISEQALKEIVRVNRKIAILSVGSLPITDQFLEFLVEKEDGRRRLYNLRELYIHHCKFTTQEGTFKFIGQCKSLKRFSDDTKMPRTLLRLQTLSDMNPQLCLSDHFKY